jgi:hypothetical protein
MYFHLKFKFKREKILYGWNYPSICFSSCNRIVRNGCPVPVILATPGEWEKSQNIVWYGAGLWSALVILTGIFNVIPE